MSLFTSKFAIHHAQGIDRPSAVRKRLVMLRLIYNFIAAVMVGSKRASAFDAVFDGEAGAKATQIVTFSSGSGTVGIIISNVTITVTWATSDILSMSALVVAVNASVNAAVQFQVQMTNLRSQVTLTSTPVGSVLRLGQFDFTAVNGVPTSGPQNWGDWDMSGSDTADALALATAINTHPQASKYWAAISTAGVVSVFLISTPIQADGSTSTAMLATNAAIAIAAQPAAAAVGLLVSYMRDRVVNAITTVATGTGVTAGGARLTGGTGGNAVPYQEAV